MGVFGAGGNKDGRREVDAELNLIPFIDLLSTLILFLLLTVVWVQVSQMSAFSQAGGETMVTHSDVSSIRQDREDRDWDVLLTTEGVEIRADEKVLGKFALLEVKKAFATLKPQLTNPAEAKVSLRASNDVIWDDLMFVLDALYSADLKNVQIAGFD
jgi:biopolymer transport protein ExbD